MKFFTTSKISENLHETPEGFLVCVGVSIARIGDMTYGSGESPLEPGPDGKVIISRDQREVFRPETIASFEGKPVTILHPDDFVNPENWSKLSKGIVQNVHRGEGEQSSDLVADLLITDSVAIKLVKNGLREVSCGYEAEYTQTGVGRGVQSNIIGNHLALVEEGRAGSSYSINDAINGKGSKMKLSEKIKAVFAKAQDEAVKIADETKDENTETTQAVSGFVTMKDVQGYFDGKFEAMMGKKADDASSKPTQAEPAKIVAKDEEAEKKEKEAKDAEELEKKKAARDAYVDAMMEKESKEKSEDDDDEGEEEEATDDDDDDYGKSADSASRVEILAPGMKASGKNLKVKALLAAYATKDGKEVIHQFTGGKELDVKNAMQVDAIFVGASEVLKGKRSSDLSKTRTRDESVSGMGTLKGSLSPEQVNEINRKHYEKIVK
jgi:hypothetical protein